MNYIQARKNETSKRKAKKRPKVKTKTKVKFKLGTQTKENLVLAPLSHSVFYYNAIGHWKKRLQEI